MNTQTFRELTYTMRPHVTGMAPGCVSRSESTAATIPTTCPQAITVTDAQGRWAVYVPLRVNGKIVVPQRLVDSGRRLIPR